MNSKHIKLYAMASLTAVFVFSELAFAQDTKTVPADTLSQTKTTVLPVSDPTNSGGWILRNDISDEFEGDKIDESKWFVEGANDEFYIWKGRAPSQFAYHNVLVENGKLKLRSQWEPDFKFANDEGHEGNTYRTHEGKDIPVTTAGVITKKRFLNGYMEVKSKAGNATMTSSFWAIGYESELDIYEQMGRPKTVPGDIGENTLKSSVHDWQPPAQRPTRKFGGKDKLPFRVADDFHVYGCEWGEDYLKMFVDGKQIYSITQADVGKDWVLTNPLEIWLDSEIFVWLGLPDAKELPVDFEIEYLRVWQKPQTNLLDRAFYGFEGPILYEDNPRPLTLVPESSVEDEYQKFWRIDKNAARNLSIVRHEKFASGTRSLKFSSDTEFALDGGVVVAGPAGSVKLPAGEFNLSMRVWVEPSCTLKTIHVSLDGPALEIEPFDISGIEKEKWITVSQKFLRDEASTAVDRMRIKFLKPESVANGAVYVDDIAIEPAK